MTLRVSPLELVRQAEATGQSGLVSKHPSWSRVPLGEIASVVNGAAFKSANFNIDGNGIPLIRIRDVGSDRVSTWYDGAWEERYLVAPGDLLVGMDGDFRAARWTAGQGLLNQRVCRISVDPKRYEPKFLEYALPGYLDLIWAATSATTVKHLSSRSIQDIPLPNPPLEEQRRIVEILEDHLSRLDAAADYESAASGRLGSLRRASLNSMFGTADRYVPLADLVVRIEAGKSLGAATAPAREGEWGIIKVSAMTSGEFRQEENKAIAIDHVNPKYEIRPGDLLVSRANTAEYVGASVLVDEEVRPRLLLSDKSLRIVPRPGVDSTWLWRALQSPAARAQISALATGTKDSMRNISQRSLLDVQLPAVDVTAQREAVSRYVGIDTQMRTLDSELARVRRHNEALRRGVLAAAFSGKMTSQDIDKELLNEPADVPSRYSDMTVTA